MNTSDEKAAEEGRVPIPSPSVSAEHDMNDPEKDPFLVTWNGKDDPEDPKNWTKRQKWAATFVSHLTYQLRMPSNLGQTQAVASFTFISPVSSSIIAPATSKIAADFGITNASVAEISYSVFVLGYAFGPLFLSPLSEIYGRSRILQFANLFYLIFNTVAGFSRNTGELIAFRFLSGLGGSAPLAVSYLCSLHISTVLTPLGRWRSTRRRLAHRGTWCSSIHLLSWSLGRACGRTYRRCLDCSMHNLAVDSLGSLDRRRVHPARCSQILAGDICPDPSSSEGTQTAHRDWR